MKTKAIVVLFCVFALLAVNSATAKTDYTSLYVNEDGQISKFCNLKNIELVDSHCKDKTKQIHPSYDELMDCIQSISTDEKNYVEAVSEAAEEENTRWPWDIWEAEDGTRFISFYYKSGSEGRTVEKCVGPNCGDKVTDDDEKEREHSSWKDDDEKESYEIRSSRHSDEEREDEEKIDLQSNTFSMSNEDKIRSVVKFAKAQGMDEDEIKFLETVLPHYWGY